MTSKKHSCKITENENLHKSNVILYISLCVNMALQLFTISVKDDRTLFTMDVLIFIADLILNQGHTSSEDDLDWKQ